MSDTAKCRYESGESCPASWPRCSPQAASVCGHHKVDVDLEMEKAVQSRSGFDFDFRYIGWKYKTIGSGRCDQLRCVACISIESHGDLHGIITALQARLGAVACDTNVIAVSYQFTGSSSITPVQYRPCDQICIKPLGDTLQATGAATCAEPGRLHA